LEAFVLGEVEDGPADPPLLVTASRRLSILIISTRHVSKACAYSWRRRGFTLCEHNNYSAQLPWSAYSRLHLSLQANDTVELYRDGDYVCDCVQYELVLERGDDIMLTMKSNSPVRGRFTARQEIPLEKQLLAFILLSAGLIGVAISIRTHRKKAVNPVM
jgi:hypothetical protein